MLVYILYIMKCLLFQISHFKIPHYVRFMSEYPLTVSGKVQKYKMREDFIANT